MKLRGFKTVLAGVAIALTAIFSSAEVQAFIAEHIPSIGGAIGTLMIALRILTSSTIFDIGGGKPKGLTKGRRFSVLLACALVLPLLGACSIAEKADTPLKKWAIAQEAHTAASDSLIGLIEAGQVDKALALRIDGWLDHARDILDVARTFIQGGDDASALSAILEATRIIDNIMEEIESVTARNTSVIPWPDVSRVGPGRNGLVHYLDAGGGGWPRPDERGNPGDPDEGGRIRSAA